MFLIVDFGEVSGKWAKRFGDFGKAAPSKPDKLRWHSVLGLAVELHGVRVY